MSLSTPQQRRQAVLPRKALGRPAASKLPTLLGSAPSSSPKVCKEERRPIEEPQTPDLSPSSILDSALDRSQHLLDELFRLHLHDDKSRIKAHISYASFDLHDTNEINSEEPSACVSPPRQTSLVVPEDKPLLCAEMLPDCQNKHHNDEDSISTCSTEASSRLGSPALSTESPPSSLADLDSSRSSIGSSASSAWVWPTAENDPVVRLRLGNRAVASPGCAVNSPPRPVPASRHFTPRSPTNLLRRGFTVATSPRSVVSARRMPLQPVARTTVRHVLSFS